MSFKFLGDYVAVKFTGLDKVFDIAENALTFTLFGNEIVVKWYGVIIAFGFTLAVLFGGRMAYKWKMDLNKMIDVLIYGTFCGIVGARLYFVFSTWDYYSVNPAQIFNLRGGGLAIYGGLIGGIVGAYLTCKFEKLNFYNLLDMAGMSFLIGQGIGRWGNFTNQEAFGTNTTLPWGMSSAKITEDITRNLSSLAEKGIEMNPALPVHPTFLYESLWCLAGFGILYLICRKWRKFSGQIFLCYGIWYGAGRFIFEGLRTDSLYIANSGIRISQLLSALIIVACAAILIIKLIKYAKNPQPIEGVDFFQEPLPLYGKAAKEAREQAKAKAKAEKEAKKAAKASGFIKSTDETPANEEDTPESDGESNKNEEPESKNSENFNE